MKSIKFLIAFFLGVMLLHTACEPDYDTPPATIPEATIRANTTILELKQAFPQDTASIGYKSGDTPYIIEGVVIGNDISGNIFKQLMIQDATAAITIAIDASNLSNTYRLGQKVVINCTGLKIGVNGGLQQLGDFFNGRIGRMAETLFQSHTELSGWPDAKIDTLTVTIPELNALTNLTARMPYMSQLVKLKGVYFVNAGQPFAQAQSTTNQTVKDTLENRNSITLVNSGYSNFYTDLLPSGVGDIVAILGYFNAYQLTLVNRAGVYNFNGTPVPEPPVEEPNSETNPYSITEALSKVGETGVWITGYIVGCVDGAVVADGADFVAPFSSQSNILLAAKAGETTIANLMPVQLTFGTDARNQLNLNQNPGNLGKLILIKGDVATYFNVPGIKNITEFSIK